MTKNEFAQRVAIALVGNPKVTDYVNFSCSEITQKADMLADFFEEKPKNGDFDFSSPEIVIHDAINDLQEELEREFDIKNNIQ